MFSTQCWNASFWKCQMNWFDISKCFRIVHCNGSWANKRLSSPKYLRTASFYQINARRCLGRSTSQSSCLPLDDVCCDSCPDWCFPLLGQLVCHWAEKESFSHHRHSAICQKSPNFCPCTEFSRGWAEASDISRNCVTPQHQLLCDGTSLGFSFVWSYLLKRTKAVINYIWSVIE